MYSHHQWTFFWVKCELENCTCAENCLCSTGRTCSSMRFAILSELKCVVAFNCAIQPVDLFCPTCAKKLQHPFHLKNCKRDNPFCSSLLAHLKSVLFTAKTSAWLTKSDHANLECCFLFGRVRRRAITQKTVRFDANHVFQIGFLRTSSKKIGCPEGAEWHQSYCTYCT